MVSIRSLAGHEINQPCSTNNYFKKFTTNFTNSPGVTATEGTKQKSVFMHICIGNSALQSSILSYSSTWKSLV